MILNYLLFLFYVVFVSVGEQGGFDNVSSLCNNPFGKYFFLFSEDPKVVFST